MKKISFFAVMLGLAGALTACGGNRDSNSDSMGETPDTINDYMDGETGVAPMDTIRRDSTDTLGQPTPTPPMN
ncbi:MAG TPA: hypothetical protein VK017_10160 [Sphingobacterium sp.]|jgi:ABC-type glycerol-3-phosphate transport system substrate-binding protein|nr:hypothetical protein [Sphingobacterium sp.]